MVTKMSELDIKALTREAEAGNGCSLKSQLQSLSYDEVRSAMMQMSEQNRSNRKEHPGKQPLVSLVETSSSGTPDKIKVLLPGEHWYSLTPQIIFEATEAQAPPGKTGTDHYSKCLNIKTKERQEDAPKPHIAEKDKKNRRNDTENNSANDINLGYGAIPSPSIFITQ